MNPIADIPVPDELGEKLWHAGPIVYLLVVAVIAVCGALTAVFVFYRQSEKERREDWREDLKVLTSLSHILEKLHETTSSGIGALKTEIASAAQQTQAHVTHQIDSIRSRLK